MRLGAVGRKGEVVLGKAGRKAYMLSNNRQKTEQYSKKAESSGLQRRRRLLRVRALLNLKREMEKVETSLSYSNDDQDRDGA